MAARIVCGAGVPHVPVFPSLARAGNADVADRYAAVRGALQRADPSLLIVVGTDHLNEFFLDRVPTFALHLGDRLSGPIDRVPGMRSSRLHTDPQASLSLAQSLLESGFDLLLCRHSEVDHSVAVPLHFLNERRIPVVVLVVNAYVAPLPTARRCYELGAALARAIHLLAREHRVAIVASGSFSQEVGGPRVDPGRAWSVPRPDWASRVVELLRRDAVEEILRDATPEMLADAGSVAGELLTWIVMVGAVRALQNDVAVQLDHQPGEAFAYGAWSIR